jgi:hypothetical protein
MVPGHELASNELAHLLTSHSARVDSEEHLSRMLLFAWCFQQLSKGSIAFLHL